MLSDAIIMSIIVSVSGLLALLFKLCYSSKCTTIECCLGKINRDVTNEVEINMNGSTRQL